jgi:TusA-related sulfurtransferase
MLMLEAVLDKSMGAPSNGKRILVDRRRAQEPQELLEVSVDKTIDVRGAYSPEPLMALMCAVRKEPAGSILEVLSTFPGSAKEIPCWTGKAGHEHLSTEKKNGYWSILVKKN